MIYYTVINTSQRKNTNTVSLTQSLHSTENQEQELDERYWALINDHEEAAFALNGTTVTNTVKEEEKEERKNCNLLFL